MLGLHAEPGESPGEGHAWLTLTAADGSLRSLSLHPEHGLVRDAEIDRAAPAVRTLALEPAMADRLDAAVAEMAAADMPLRGAASFAAGVWSAVTGEALAVRRWGVLPCPGRLAEAIAALAADAPLPPEPSPRPRWSPTPVSDCVVACAAPRVQPERLRP